MGQRGSRKENRLADAEVLVVGERLSPNLGDGVICETVEMIIAKKFPSCHVHSLDISGRVEYSDDIDWVLSPLQRIMGRLISRNIARSMLVKEQISRVFLNQQIDLVVFAGGQMFMDYFAHSIKVIVREANRRRIPVIFNACGIGANSRASARSIKKTLGSDCVSAISIRDSREYFEKRLLPRGVSFVEVMDPAIELSKFWHEGDMEAINKQHLQEGVVLGVNIMNPTITGRVGLGVSHALNKKILTQVVDFCEHEKINWSVYSNGSECDQQYIESLCSEAGVDSSRIAIRPETPKDLISLIGGYSHILGFRMHTHIIANALDIKTLGFVWDNKVMEYARKTGQEGSFFKVHGFDIDNLGELLMILISTEYKEAHIDNIKMSSDFLSEEVGKLLQRLKGYS